MPQSKIIGYKRIFGFVLPDWVDESLIRSLVTILLASMAMMFVLIIVIWPKFDTVNSLKKSLVTSQQALDSLKNSQTGFNKLNDQISEADQNVILAAIPLSYSPEQAVFSIRSLSNEAGVSIVSYTLPSGVLYSSGDEKLKNNNEGSPVDFTSYPILITVSAPVSSLLTFINKIESSIPFGVVSDMNMQEVTKLSRTSSKSIQMNLQVTYYQAVLKGVNISKISPITSTELSLAKEMLSYERSNYSGNTITEMPVATGAAVGSSTGLFGF